MPDRFTKTKRSQVMRAVRSVRTGAERKFERVLNSLEVHFIRNASDLPGRPDFVLPKEKLALFVNGCFWHGHEGCKNAVQPSSNVEYWSCKILKNRRRDRRVRDSLRREGWRTAVVWECQLRDEVRVLRRLSRIVTAVTRKTS